MLILPAQKIPVALVDDEDKKTFIYKEEDLPSQFFASPGGHHHSLPSASIGREDIQQVAQDPHHAIDARSTFGGSQSASASMSASMNRIVEGVERLVESDTYENGPTMPDPLTFSQNVNQPLRSSRMFDPSTESIFREENFPPRQTPIAPPGLGPPMPGAAALVRDPSSQSYTSRSLPGIPSIWNTASPDLGEASSPRTPPGLGHRPAHVMPGSVGAPGHHHQPSQEAIANELLLRQSLMNQTTLQNPLIGSGTMSPWMGAANPVSHRLSGLGWERAQLEAAHSPASLGVPSQPISSGLANAPWANDAFIASSLSSVPGYPSSGFNDNRKSSTQYGAIGQSPPCGQGG